MTTKPQPPNSFFAALGIVALGIASVMSLVASKPVQALLLATLAFYLFLIYQLQYANYDSLCGWRKTLQALDAAVKENEELKQEN